MSSSRGFTLMEAVVATTVFALGVVGLVNLFLISKSTSEQGRDAVQAANFLQEGIEGVRALRDADWNNVATAGAYRLNPQPGQNPAWQLLSGGSESITGTKYSRAVQIADVSREDTDGSGTLTAGDRIVTSGGTLADTDTKKLTVTVSWTQGSRTVTRTTYMYLTRWQS